MSDNKLWKGVTPGFEQSEEDYFNSWAFFENKFNEFGEPGFSEQTLPVGAPHIFGHDDKVDVRFTLYRGEDGQLLFVHGCYIDEHDNDLQKPFIWMVHPDHGRKGIGTMMATYLIERHEKERGFEYTYEQSLRNVVYNAASATFANKYMNKKYEEKK